MTQQERFNQVEILEEEQPSKGVLDADKREIAHSILVVRKGDGVTLAKYRAKEFVTERNAKGELVEKAIPGKVAAQKACETNGWKIAKN
jgi:hypothetical protein